MLWLYSSSFIFYRLDSSGHLYGALLSLALNFKNDVNCTVLRMVSKFIHFRNVAFQTALPQAYEFYG